MSYAYSYYDMENAPVYVTLRNSIFSAHNGETVAIPIGQLTSWHEFLYCLSAYFPPSVSKHLSTGRWELVTAIDDMLITPENWAMMIRPGMRLILKSGVNGSYLPTIMSGGLYGYGADPYFNGLTPRSGMEGCGVGMNGVYPAAGMARRRRRRSSLTNWFLS